MSYDNRIALNTGYELTVTEDHSGNTYKATIENEIGRGGSCLVYSGTLSEWVGDENIDRKVIIKEFYPLELTDMFSRSKDNSKLKLTDASAQATYDSLLSSFFKGQKKHIVFADDNADKSLPAPFCSGRSEETDTYYVMSNRFSGTTLEDLDRSTLDLKKALELSISICEAIRVLHGKLLYYLDMKPENIYVTDNRAFLFDFGTVQAAGRPLRYHSYSQGWSAPEQEITDNSGYKDPGKIGYHTDIYSIGATILYLLTGDASGSSRDEIDQADYDWSSKVTLNDPTKALSDTEAFIPALKRLLDMMLEKDPDKRKESFGGKNSYVGIEIVISSLKNLIALTENVPYKTGFADTNKNLDDVKDELTKKIEETSVQNALLGSKKKKMLVIGIAAGVVILGAITIGIISGLTQKTVETVGNAIQSQQHNVELELNTDRYILLKLENANHQYEVGLENWRRLDYNRAERDILAARNDKSSETAQSEIDVAKMNNSLGCLYIDMGRYNDSYDYLNSAYITFRDQYGEESVETRAVRASLAQYYFYTGKIDEALKETQYIIDNSDPENEKAIMASILHLRANIFDAQGKYSDALDQYNKVLDMYNAISADGKLNEQLATYANDPNLNQNEKDNLTNTIRWIILTYNNIAAVNIHSEDYQAAIDAAKTGLDIGLSNDYITQRNLTSSKLYMNLAIAEGKSNQIDEALDDIDLAMRIQRNLFDFEDVFPGLVNVYDAYGDLLLIKGKNDEAEAYYNDAVTLAESSFGINHPITADAYCSLGKFLSDTDSDSALEYLEEAIEVRKNILAENHPDTANIYYELAMVQKKAGDSEASMESLSKAKDICDNCSVTGELHDKIYSEIG